jgi:hypothetical protein
LDDCEVPQSVQAKIFSGTMWHILQLQQAQAPSKDVNQGKQ